MLSNFLSNFIGQSSSLSQTSSAANFQQSQHHPQSSTVGGGLQQTNNQQQTTNNTTVNNPNTTTTNTTSNSTNANNNTTNTNSTSSSNNGAPPQIDAEETDKVVGYGAFGVVWSVTDPRTGRRVALKKMPNVFQTVVSAKRVFREVKMLCTLKHENVWFTFSMIILVHSIGNNVYFPFRYYIRLMFYSRLLSTSSMRSIS